MLRTPNSRDVIFLLIGPLLLIGVLKASNVSTSASDSCGTANFDPATNFSTDLAPISVVVADFNNDGKSDIATANLNAGNVSLFLGDGTGGFSGPTNFSAGNGPSSIAAGDFNGDGISDLAVTLQGSSQVASRSLTTLKSKVMRPSI
ncbi:MAG TPA: VCBS repeat-containing protein [Pyrinomonadaceae bacterium]|nr:VCBS repeat-containing protein [Pyrinomonadaceae bacterium]